MKERIYFKGLETDEFIHPKEKELKEALMTSKGYKKIVGTINDVVTTYMATMKAGVYTKLSKSTSPDLFDILEDVCRILDIDTIPELYLRHAYSHDIVPCGEPDAPYLVMSDYDVKVCDRDMLYYLFGNAMTMIKAGHVEITNIGSCLTENIWLTAPQMAIKKFLHVADATSDRGGLLACQSFSAAIRCQFIELGLPVNEIKRMFTNDEETANYIKNYLFSVDNQNRNDHLLTIVAEKLINLDDVEAPAHDMLRELYDWYCQGYPQLIEKYSMRQ